MATTTTTTVCGVRARPLAPPPVQVPPLPTTVGPLVPLQYVPPPGVPLVTPTHAGGARAMPLPLMAPPAFVGVTCGTAAGGGMYASGTAPGGTAPGAMRMGTSGPTVVGSGGTWTGGGASGRARTPQTVVVVVVAIAVWGRSLKATATTCGGVARALMGWRCYVGARSAALQRLGCTICAVRLQ